MNLSFQSVLGYGSAYPAMGTGSVNPLANLLASLNGYKTETEEEEAEEEPYTPAPPSPFDGNF